MEKELFGLKDENGKEYKLRIESYREGFTIFAILPVEDKSKFKVGDWVKHIGLSYIYKVTGLDSDAWPLGDVVGGGYNPSVLRLATESEISDHLISVAKSKGYKKGVRFKSLEETHAYSSHTVDDMSKIRIMYSIEGDSLRVVAPMDEWERKCSNPAIYSEGKWAEIIPEKKKLPRTKEEAKKFISSYFDHENGNMQQFMDEYED